MSETVDIYGGRSPRDVAFYAPADAARILRVNPATIGTWAFGRRYSTREGAQTWPALIEAADPHGKRLSFRNLVELYVLSVLRGKDGHARLEKTNRVGIDKIRAVVEPYLLRIERDEAGLARRLYPPTRDDGAGPRTVVIDPMRRFGRPVLVSANIETSAIADRFFAGDDLGALASDFEITESDVNDAVRFEYLLRRAA